MRARFLTLIPICALQFAYAQRVGAPTDDLTNLSADDLFQIQVTSVGRKAQQLSKAPAAVFVLTAEDIRRSGATSIPEALQWVPGLTVLSVDGRSWAISARGSARLYADKILVMIDGRSLYTPLFAGVIWDSIDVPMEDIEQIEVVRGPGAVMWGPNAVNGVINIITKRALSTKGAAMSVAGGNELHGSIWARWGAAPSDRLAYRVWVKLDDRDPAFSSPGYYRYGPYAVFEPGQLRNLDSKSVRAGFRVDYQPTEKDSVMFEGDVHGLGRHEGLGYPLLMPVALELLPGHTDYRGGFIQARWTRTESAGNEQSLQFTFNKDNLDYPYITGEMNNLTVDFEKRRQTSDRNEVFFGAGFQQYWDDTAPGRFSGFVPAQSMDRVGDGVVRDEFQLIPGRLLASAGVRVDSSSYAHFEFQPSLRLLYTPSARQSAWIAVSRAVRVPSRVDRDLVNNLGRVLVQGIPIVFHDHGTSTMRSETERSVEVGYRVQSGQRWSLDEAVFWSYYDKLRVLARPALPDISFNGPVPTFSMSVPEQNGGTGRSYGSETSATWQVNRQWRLIPSYTYLNETQWLPTPTPLYAWLFASSGSRHQAFLRSRHDLSRHLQLDLMARARSRNLAFELPGVLLLDSRLSWRPAQDTEFSCSIKNLTGREVLETYSESAAVAIPVRRTFVFQWTQRF
ncbi:MAG TPA: TonB-dependent receptor [Bryobacteraceae bacterium]|nr:TonB-dependent receptor [Bryobacteraceae bacterium]